MEVNENKTTTTVRGLRIDVYPNPTHSASTIEYSLVSGSRVTCSVYDVTGREVRSLVSAQQASGVHSVPWDGYDDNGRPVRSGIYLVRIITSEESVQEKLILCR